MKWVETETSSDKIIQEWDNIEDVMYYILHVSHKCNPEIPLPELKESRFYINSRFYLTEPESHIIIGLENTCIKRVH